MRRIRLGGMALFSVLLHAGAAVAAPGDIDRTFGTAGVVATPLSSGGPIVPLALQSGKLLVGGTGSVGIAIARYDGSGQPDVSFGVGGIVDTDLQIGASGVSALSVAHDDRIAVSGRIGFISVQQYVARYLPDGTFDPGWNSGVPATTDVVPGMGPQDVPRAVLVQPDDKVVVALVGGDAFNADFALLRFADAGALDAGFGAGGIVTTDFGTVYEEPLALLRQTDGRLVAAGGSGFHANFALARYDGTGMLDSAFGAGGLVTTALPYAFMDVRSIVQQPDDDLVVAGVGSGPAVTSDVVLARYHSDGTLDQTFGHGGITTLDVAGGLEDAGALVLQPDGKLVVAGTTQRRKRSSLVLARFTSDGASDLAFGSAGFVSMPLGPAGLYNVGLVLMPDGALVAAVGNVPHDAHFGVSLFRYQGGDPLHCNATPLTGCRSPLHPAKSTLRLRRRAASMSRRFTWQWGPGSPMPDTGFGDPPGGTDYVACLYDESATGPRVIFEAAAPGGGLCGTKPCWTTTKDRGFAYRDKVATPHGLTTLRLTGKLSGPDVTVRGAGEKLALPDLPLALPVRLQLQTAHDGCWETRYSTARRNEPSEFKAFGDSGP